MSGKRWEGRASRDVVLVSVVYKTSRRSFYTNNNNSNSNDNNKTK